MDWRYVQTFVPGRQKEPRKHDVAKRERYVSLCLQQRVHSWYNGSNKLKLSYTIAFFLKKKYYCVLHGFLLLTEKMKHLEETINQYHIQSEKNLEGKESFRRNPSGN